MKLQRSLPSLVLISLSLILGLSCSKGVQSKNPAPSSASSKAPESKDSGVEPGDEGQTIDSEEAASLPNGFIPPSRPGQRPGQGQSGQGASPQDSKSTSSTVNFKKRKALIILSSARSIMVSSEQGAREVSVGHHLMELASVLRTFEAEYDFILATPDGRAPQIDLNGFDLNLYPQGNRFIYLKALAKSEEPSLGLTQESSSMLGLDEAADVYRKSRRNELDRRNQDIRVGLRHLGNVSISDPTPASHPELVEIRGDIVQNFSSMRELRRLSFKELAERMGREGDPIQYQNFDFVFVPGGHAAMVDLSQNAYLGKVLNTCAEQKILIATVGHGAAALLSAQWGLDDDEKPVQLKQYALQKATVATLSRYEQELILNLGFMYMPELGSEAQLSFFLDEKLKSEEFLVVYGASKKKVFKGSSLAPGSSRIAHDGIKNVLSANGPQAVDEFLEMMKDLLAEQKALRALPGPEEE